MKNLVLVDRNRVRDFGGSLYVLLPRAMRQGSEVQAGDDVTFHRAPGSTDTVIRIIKQTSKSMAARD